MLLKQQNSKIQAIKMKYLRGDKEITRRGRISNEEREEYFMLIIER